MLGYFETHEGRGMPALLLNHSGGSNIATTQQSVPRVTTGHVPLCCLLFGGDTMTDSHETATLIKVTLGEEKADL